MDTALSTALDKTDRAAELAEKRGTGDDFEGPLVSQSFTLPVDMIEALQARVRARKVANLPSMGLTAAQRKPANLSALVREAIAEWLKKPDDEGRRRR